MKSWLQRERLSKTVAAIVVGLILWAWLTLPSQTRPLPLMENLSRLLGRMFPPDFSIAPSIGSALVETIQIALLATFWGVLISVPLGFLSTHKMVPSGVVIFSRFILTVIRTIPALVWALIAVSLQGPTPQAGILALAFYSVGYLAKFYADIFESIDLRLTRALKKLGANKIQIFSFGIWPQCRGLVWTQALWMFEYNLRSASIVGFVGAGGLGTLLYTYQEYYQWDRFSAVLCVLLVFVVALEILSSLLRRRMNQTLQQSLPNQEAST
jgi:phosphonate transport system permease protein